MSITPLPTSPSLENLRKRAKTLLKRAKSEELAALAEVGPYFGDPSKISLQQAQLVIARAHGFSSWTKLKRHIDSGAGQAETTEQRANRFLDLACMYYGLDQSRSSADFETASALLEAHPEIATHSLHAAAAAGDEASVRTMLAANPAGVDEPGGPFQWTPLMYAAYARLPGRSTWPAGRALIQAGADPNAHYMWGGTYRFAVLTGVFGDGEGGPVKQPPHPDMVPFARALLDAGANPNDSQGAYNRCFRPDNTHLELMLEYGLKDSDPSDWWLTEPDRKPEDHRTMHFQLIMALRWGFADRARLLIEHGVDLNTPDDNYYPTYTVGYMPYQVALMRGLPEIAELIREHGGRADPLEPPQLLQAALMSGDLDTARELAPKHLESIRGDLLEIFRDAAGKGNLAAVETMLAVGIDPSPPHSRTPLHAAAIEGHVAIMEALLAGGADPTIRDPDYFSTPLGHAQHAHEQAAIDILLEQRMDIFAATAFGNLSEIERLLDEDVEWANRPLSSVLAPGGKRPDNHWARPLWFAIMNKRSNAAEILLNRGADPNVTDPDGATMVEIARANGATEIVNLIVTAS